MNLEILYPFEGTVKATDLIVEMAKEYNLDVEIQLHLACKDWEYFEVK